MSTAAPKRIPTFANWLVRQDGRDDPVGDLATDYKEEKHRRRVTKRHGGDFPTGSEWGVWIRYLQTTAAEDALREAYLEWATLAGIATDMVNSDDGGL